MNTSEKTHQYQRPAPPPPPLKRKRFPWWTLVVIVFCIGVLGWIWSYAEAQLDSYQTFINMRNAVAGDRFFGDVTIDGMQLNGMTFEEARAVLTKQQQETISSFNVTLTHGDASWSISEGDIPMEWDTESLLRKAYTVGRVGTLEERYREITSLIEPVAMTSEFTYDKSTVRMMTDMVATHLTVQAQNASVVSFDPQTRSFSFTQERAGQTVDPEKLYQATLAALESGRAGSVVEVETIPLTPSVTQAQLQQNYGLITSFNTRTTDNKNRNNNIRIAAEALSGKVVPAQGEISFNESTGERTPDKGYLEAGAIENGRTVQEYGGGVCQVSTTLFNALVRANCEIVSRKPHAWPSDYVPKGEDATVDWPRLDLVMRNPTEMPMYIVAWYEDRTVTVEVYGYSLGEGVTIALESEVTYTKVPDRVVYTYKENLPVGTQQKVKDARTGYALQTYKITLRDGVEISREKFYTSDYRAIYEEYEYNDGKGPPPTDSP